MKTRIAIVLLFLAGIAIFFYPDISNYLEEKNHVRVIETYQQEVTNMEEEKVKEEFARAKAYNVSLGNTVLIDPFTESQANGLSEDYYMLLDFDGVMGRIRIPKIQVDLPIFHGTSEEVLQKGVGHLIGTSLPIGGIGTHAVLSGHRGLPSAQLFSKLDELEVGDSFYLEVLNETRLYQVDQIKVVLPEQTEDLSIENNKDYVTLVTCTPYSVNTHRLLVRGTFIKIMEKETDMEELQEEQENVMKNKIVYAIAGGIFLLGLIVFLYPTFSAWRSERAYEKQIQSFEDTRAKENTTGNKRSESGKDQDTNPDRETKPDQDINSDTYQDSIKTAAGTPVNTYQDLYKAMEEYNQNIYDNGQMNLKDPFSYEEPSFQLSDWGIADEMFGYLDIPAMDLRLPIYLGATKANMAKGAAHLTQTSIPIGGTNTNAVIAAHRGYSKSPMFRNIDRLNLGDTVTLRNLWETLTYEVSDIKVIYPNEIDQVLIQPGEDMLTLITCHPYTQNSRRYVVYCKRQS